MARDKVLQSLEVVERDAGAELVTALTSRVAFSERFCPLPVRIRYRNAAATGVDKFVCLVLHLLKCSTRRMVIVLTIITCIIISYDNFVAATT